MVMEYVGGAVVGLMVGIIAPRIIIKIQNWIIRRNAKKKILKQKYDYYIKTDQDQAKITKIDLKKILSPGSDPITKAPVPDTKFISVPEKKILKKKPKNFNKKSLIKEKLNKKKEVKKK